MTAYRQMRTVGDVRADVDRTLSDIGKLKLSDGLQPLVARLQKLTADHPEVFRSAIDRIRAQLPSDVLTPPPPPPIVVVPPVAPYERLRPPIIIERPIRDVTHEVTFNADIPPGESSIVAWAKMVFRGLHLVIPNEECTDGDLVSIRIGNRHQDIVSGPRPLSLYCPARWADEKLMKGAWLDLDTATVAQDITLVVNVRRPMRFQAILRGIGAC